jgi:hypothetical protein
VADAGVDAGLQVCEVGEHKFPGRVGLGDTGGVACVSEGLRAAARAQQPAHVAGIRARAAELESCSPTMTGVAAGHAKPEGPLAAEVCHAHARSREPA